MTRVHTHGDFGHYGLLRDINMMELHLFLPSLGVRVLRDPEPEDAHLESSKND